MFGVNTEPKQYLSLKIKAYDTLVQDGKIDNNEFKNALKFHLAKYFSLEEGGVIDNDKAGTLLIFHKKNKVSELADSYNMNEPIADDKTFAQVLISALKSILGSRFDMTKHFPKQDGKDLDKYLHINVET